MGDRHIEGGSHHSGCIEIRIEGIDRLEHKLHTLGRDVFDRLDRIERKVDAMASGFDNLQASLTRIEADVQAAITLIQTGGNDAALQAASDTLNQSADALEAVLPPPPPPPPTGFGRAAAPSLSRGVRRI